MKTNAWIPMLAVTTTIALLSPLTARAALIFYDGFAYTAPSNLGGQGGWANQNTGDEVTVGSGNLSVDGLTASVGNHIEFGGTGFDPERSFTSVGSASVYYSLAFQVTAVGSLASTPGVSATPYVVGLGSSTAFGSTIWLRADGSGYNIGLGKRTALADVVWNSTVFSVSDTVFVVGEYVLGAAAGDDVSRLWINPDSSSFSGIAPAADLTSSTTGTDLSSVSRFFVRQNSTTETPGSISLDEVRVGTTYADVTPGVTPVPEPRFYALLCALGLLAMGGGRVWLDSRRARLRS